MFAVWQIYGYFNIVSNIVNKKTAKKQLFLAFRFFLAFDDKAGHNFINRSGTNKFDTTRRIAWDEYFKMLMRIVYKNKWILP